VHPHHPLSGQQFDLISQGQAWGEDRVFFRDAGGQLRSMPTGWTSVAMQDPFVVVAAGRSLFRLEDLIALCALVRDLGGQEAKGRGEREEREGAGDVKGITP
jgi:hypothetical protein